MSVTAKPNEVPDVAALVARAKTHPAFIGLEFAELPRPSDWVRSWLESVDGVPVRHYKAWDVIKDVVLHRADVYAVESIAGVKEKAA